jgi:Raf kinase inhibitor-like YbhB/YbcL family protein
MNITDRNGIGYARTGAIACTGKIRQHKKQGIFIIKPGLSRLIAFPFHIMKFQQIRDAQNFISSYHDCLTIYRTGQAGEDFSSRNRHPLNVEAFSMARIIVTTLAFKHGSDIPAEYTCSGKNVSPACEWSGVPESARSIVVIMDDPDAPSGLFTHWILFNIPPEKSRLDPGIPKKPVFEDGSMHGTNSFGRAEYGGPCPPPGKPHRYFLKAYALDAKLSLRAPVTRNVIDSAMTGHILAEGGVMGTFRR